MTFRKDTVWVDNNTFIGTPAPCFICGNLTDRIDINYEGAYCGADECEDFIRRDLEALS